MAFTINGVSPGSNGEQEQPRGLTFNGIPAEKYLQNIGTTTVQSDIPIVEDSLWETTKKVGKNLITGIGTAVKVPGRLMEGDPLSVNPYAAAGVWNNPFKSSEENQIEYVDDGMGNFNARSTKPKEQLLKEQADFVSSQAGRAVQDIGQGISELYGTQKFQKGSWGELFGAVAENAPRSLMYMAPGFLPGGQNVSNALMYQDAYLERLGELRRLNKEGKISLTDDQMKDKAAEYGLAEMLPEAAGNAASIGLAKRTAGLLASQVPGSKFARSILKIVEKTPKGEQLFNRLFNRGIVSKTGAVILGGLADAPMEGLTEGVTQYHQGKQDIELGLMQNDVAAKDITWKNRGTQLDDSIMFAMKVGALSGFTMQTGMGAIATDQQSKATNEIKNSMFDAISPSKIEEFGQKHNVDVAEAWDIAQRTRTKAAIKFLDLIASSGISNEEKQNVRDNIAKAVTENKNLPFDASIFGANANLTDADFTGVTNPTVDTTQSVQPTPAPASTSSPIVTENQAMQDAAAQNINAYVDSLSPASTSQSVVESTPVEQPTTDWANTITVTDSAGNVVPISQIADKTTIDSLSTKLTEALNNPKTDNTITTPEGQVYPIEPILQALENRRKEIENAQVQEVPGEATTEGIPASSTETSPATATTDATAVPATSEASGVETNQTSVGQTEVGQAEKSEIDQIPVQPNPPVQQPESVRDFQSFRDTLNSTDPTDTVINKRSIPDSVAWYFEGLKRRLGMTSKTVIMTEQDIKNTEIGQWMMELVKQRSSNLDPSRVKGGKFYYNLLDPETNKSFDLVIVNSNARGLVRTMILMHEAIGHAIFYREFSKAPKEIQEKIKRDFNSVLDGIKDWYNLSKEAQDNLNKAFFEPTMYKSGASLESYIENQTMGLGFSMLDQDQQNKFAIFMFDEWIANQISKEIAIIESENATPAKTLMQRWWRRIATEISNLYKEFKEANLDIVTRVESIKEYVDFLYRQNGVENFQYQTNSKDVSLVNNIFEQMFEVLNGKLIVKENWITSRVVGKRTVFGLKRFVRAYGKALTSIRKDNGVVTSVSSSPGPVAKLSDSAIRDSGYRITEAKNADGISVVHLVKTVKLNGVESTEMLATIRKEQFPSLKGISSSDLAKQALMNMRDMLIISEANLIKESKVLKILQKTLQGAEGSKLVLKIPTIEKSFIAMTEMAKVRAIETGQTELQIFLEMLSGDWSAFSKERLTGMRGTPITKETRANRELWKAKRDFAKLKKDFPDVFKLKEAYPDDIYKLKEMFPNLLSQMYKDTNAAIESNVAETAQVEAVQQEKSNDVVSTPVEVPKSEQNVTKEDSPKVPAPPVNEFTTEQEKIFNLIADMIDGKDSRGKKVKPLKDPNKIFENFKMYFTSSKNLDLVELDKKDPLLANFIETYARDVIEALTQAKVTIKLQNRKALTKDDYRTLAGMKVDFSGMEQFAENEMIIGIQAFNQLSTAQKQKLIQSYRSEVDGKMRYEFPARELGFAIDTKLLEQAADQIARTPIVPGKFRSVTGPLSGVVKFKWLYDLYPDFEYTRIQIVENYDNWGSYNGNENILRLQLEHVQDGLAQKDNNGPNYCDLIDTIIHEMQHMIQKQENFARGGNVAMMEMEIANRKDHYKTVKLLQAADMRALKDIDNLIKRDPNATINDLEDVSHISWRMSDYLRSLVGMSYKLKDIYAKIDKEEVANVINQSIAHTEKVKKAMKRIGDDPEVAYRRLGGEVEANYAAARFFLTEVERANDPLVQGDYVKNKVIFHNGIDFMNKAIGNLLSDLENEIAIDIYPKTSKVVREQTPTLTHIPDGLSNELTYELTKEMYNTEVEMAIKVKRPSKGKRTTEGPYTDILKHFAKVKKRIKAKKPFDPVKAQEKKDKLHAFIMEMNTLLQEAKLRGKSLSQHMRDSGKHTEKQIRIAIARYHRNVSKFSQSEIIMRLATELGLVNENGQSGLELLIQGLFPEERVQLFTEDGSAKLDPKGQPLYEVYEGSDGSIASLEAAARDEVITLLQKMIFRRDGQEFDITGQKSYAQLLKERQDIEAKWPVARRIAMLFKYFFRYGEGILSTTKSGSELAFRLKRARLQEIYYQRNYIIQLEIYKNKVYNTPEKLQHITDVIHGRKQASTQDDFNFIGLLTSINLAFAEEMEKLQMQIMYSSGRKEYFKFDPVEAAGYFPHMFEDKAFDDPSDRMIQSLIDSNTAVDRDHAIKKLKVMGKRRTSVAKMANMEMARETNIEGWIEDPFIVYQKYVIRGSKKLALLREFSGTPELALTRLALKHFQESKDSEAFKEARDIINDMTGIRTEIGLSRDPNFGLSAGIMVSGGLLLNHSAFVQPGVMANMAMMSNVKTLLKGISAVIKARFGHLPSQQLVEWSKLAGVLAFTVNREMWDAIETDEQTRAETDKIMRSFGITQIDSQMRIIGGICGRMAVTELVIEASQKMTPKRAWRLKRFGIDPDLIEKRKQNGEVLLTLEELSMASLAFTEETNFVVNPLTTPGMLRNNHWGRIFFLFSRFAFQQHQMWKEVLKNDKSAALRGVLTALTVGTPMLLLKTLLMGDDPEEVLKKDGVAKFLWKAFMTGSGPGLWTEMIVNSFLQIGSRQTGKIGIDSPIIGVAQSLVDGGVGAYKVLVADQATDANTHKMWSGLMTAGQSSLLLFAPPKIGVPVNAVLGTTRPIAERYLYPNQRQKQTRIGGM